MITRPVAVATVVICPTPNNIANLADLRNLSTSSRTALFNTALVLVHSELGGSTSQLLPVNTGGVSISSTPMPAAYRRFIRVLRDSGEPIDSLSPQFVIERMQRFVNNQAGAPATCESSSCKR